MINIFNILHEFKEKNMNVILEFTDKDEAFIAMKAFEMLSLIQEYLSHIRSELKYKDPSTEEEKVYQDMRDYILYMIEERDLGSIISG